MSLRELHFNNVIIAYSEQVKYLGILLDKHLSFNSHIAAITDKATKAFWACRSMYGKTWGLNPLMIFWIYSSLIRPIVLYGASVWWHRASTQFAITRLNKLQRLVCLAMCGVMRSCPTAAMEAILGLTPLHIFIKRSAAKCAFNAAIVGKNSPRRWIPPLLDDFKDYQLLCSFTDSLPKTLVFGRKFEILFPDRRVWEYITPYACQNSMSWFTDGSKTSEGVGAGIYGPHHKISLSLGHWPSVFQAELYAIEMCASLNIDSGIVGTNINIYSDSQAALKALLSHNQTSLIVQSCYNKLQILAQCNTLKLIWVPVHSNIAGNELADELAREGSSKNFTGPEPFFRIPYSALSSSIDCWELQNCIKHWNLVPGLTQSKKTISPFKFSPTVISKLGKPALRRVVGYLSGHCPLKYHLFKMNLVSDSECRLCRDDDETSIHILCECEALCRNRLAIFNKPFLEAQELKLFSYKDISAFIAKAESILLQLA